MTHLYDLLERSVDHRADVDVEADLRRGRRALRRRRSCIAAGVTGGLVAAGVVAYVALPPQQDSLRTVRPGDGATTSQPVQTTYFDIPPAPSGWHVTGERPQYLMLGRDGTESRLDDFAGQLVVMLSAGREDFDNGPSVDHDGRTFYVNDRNGDATILSVRAPGGDWLQAQYPKGAFTQQEMIAFLDGVVVEPGARPGLG